MIPVLSVTIKERTVRALYLKTNAKGFCKETIEKLTNYWTGGSYLVLRSKPMVPGDRLLIANRWKELKKHTKYQQELEQL